MNILGDAALSAPRKITIASALLLGAVGIAGCSSPSTSNGTADAPAQQQTQEQQQPLDLTGEWKQSNSNDPDSYQAATITADALTINWVSDGGSTTALYWAGTYTAPAEPADTYTWDSANDTTKTDTALLASGDPTKTFTYVDGKLSYDVTAMGVTKKVELQRQ
ncbi:hypothetical protein [Microbacterium binotii]|uniref:Lipoprotein n=1 Tax=Microbacterium binotii TaxID=462710 RepID=A0ABN3PCJ3_9MICO